MTNHKKIFHFLLPRTLQLTSRKDTLWLPTGSSNQPQRAKYSKLWNKYNIYLFAKNEKQIVAATWLRWHHSGEKVKVLIDILVVKLFL